jgi:hypothetical protein
LIICRLAGYNYITGAPEPFDTVPPQPDDQRFLQCSGPFEIEPESTAVVLVGIIFADWDTTDQRPDTALVQIDNTCQFIYDMNWLLPGPPSPPTLTCVPGDAQMTLIWSSSPENEADAYYEVVSDPGNPNLYDPFYREYDFEGYRVWRSITGQAGDWELLTVCDRSNGIVFDKPSDESEEDTLRAEDTGLFHSYLDDGVRNGFLYYYAVTSFDYNQVKDVDTLGNPFPVDIMFESGKVGYSGAPRRDPANYQPGSYAINHVSGNQVIADSMVEVAITYPLEMVSNPLYLDFGPIRLDTTSNNPQYELYLRDDADNKLDSFWVSLDVGAEAMHEFSAQNGMSITANFLRPEILNEVFDSITVVGTYPESLLVPDFGTSWAYRGNNYELHWYRAHGSDSVNSAVVIDAFAGDTIPYKPYLSVDSMADGWCFRSLTARTDTLVYSNIIPFATRYMYISGGLFKFKPSGGLQVGDPRPSGSDVWTVHAAWEYWPAPAYSRVEVMPTPAAMLGDTTFALNVKVVPNPYLIYNEWQQSFNSRRLKFINLPSDCTVRIFNLNGELVKTLKHHHTLQVEEGDPISGSAGGDEWWDLLSENRQLVASGIYIYHIESDVGEQVGKLVIIR